MLFILGADFGIAMLTALLLATKTQPIKADRWLIAAAVLFAVTAGGLGLVRSDVELSNPVRVFLGGPSFLVLFALFYFYVRDAAGRLSRYDTLWLAPAIVHFIWLTAASASQGFYVYVGGFLWLAPGHYLAPLPLLFPFIIGVLYPLLALREARRFLARSKERFASVEQYDFRWAALLQFALLGLTLCAILIVGLFGADLYLALCLIMAGMGLFLLGAGGFAFKQNAVQMAAPRMAVDPQTEPAPGAATQNAAETAAAPVISLTELNKALETEGAYLSENYTLDTLAASAGVAPEEVSRTLRENGQSFYDYVNSRRVEEAKRLLSDPQYAAISILSLAHDAGFQSKATFNRVFKNAAGLTPSAYRTQTLASRQAAHSSEKD